MLLRRYTLSLYRTQLKSAKFFDKNPHLKPLAGLYCLREELLGDFESNDGEDVPKSKERRWASRVAKAAEQFRRAFLTRQERIDDDHLEVTDAIGAAAHLHYSPPQSLASFVQMAYRQSAQGIVAPASAVFLSIFTSPGLAGELCTNSRPKRSAASGELTSVANAPVMTAKRENKDTKFMNICGVSDRKNEVI